MDVGLGPIGFGIAEPELPGPVEEVDLSTFLLGLEGGMYLPNSLEPSTLGRVSGGGLSEALGLLFAPLS